MHLGARHRRDNLRHLAVAFSRGPASFAHAHVSGGGLAAESLETSQSNEEQRKTNLRDH